MTDQRLIVNWRAHRTNEIVPVAELVVTHEQGAPRFEFGYLEGARRAINLGFQPFLAFAQLEKRYDSASLFPFFQNRVLPSTRTDYHEYVAELGFDARTADAVELLGRSGGVRQTDRIETVLAPTNDLETKEYATHFLVRGVRHVAGEDRRFEELVAGQRLDVQIEPDNQVNQRARKLFYGPQPIGYVPNYLLRDVDLLEELGESLRFEIERVNPPPKPVHYRVLVKLTAGWPEGFRSLADRDFDRYKSPPPSFGSDTALNEASGDH